MDIVIATKNKGKIKEIKSFFQSRKFPLKLDIKTFEDFRDFPDIEEGSVSFYKNAELKAKTVSEFTGFISLADDSGLVVDILGGNPGVISSRYAGIDATDSDNRLKLLTELNIFSEISKRTARFVCEMVLWHPQLGKLKHVTGLCEGHIGFEDPIFYPKGYTRTMAELSKHEKNLISHRGKALLKISKFIRSYMRKNI